MTIPLAPGSKLEGLITRNSCMPVEQSLPYYATLGGSQCWIDALCHMCTTDGGHIFLWSDAKQGNAVNQVKGTLSLPRTLMKNVIDAGELIKGEHVLFLVTSKRFSEESLVAAACQLERKGTYLLAVHDNLAAGLSPVLGELIDTSRNLSSLIRAVPIV